MVISKREDIKVAVVPTNNISSFIMGLIGNIVFSWIVFVISLIFSTYIGFGGWPWSKKALEKSKKLMKSQLYKLMGILGMVIGWIILRSCPPSDFHRL